MKKQNEKKRKFIPPTVYVSMLRTRIKRNEKAFRVYSILRILVILTLIRSLFVGNYESAAICILSLVLFLIPTFMERKLHVEIPATFQIIIYLFIYAAEILGEINRFYTIIPGWDTMLHTMNGFLCAAIGFSLLDVFNRSDEEINLSPFYLSMVAFCFSMTVGVVWEFIEFLFDTFFYLDMQKDFVVKTIASVTLDPTNSQVPFKISGITDTVINTASGQSYVVEGGYLDIGIIDTMKDLLVNFVGAMVFSVIGWLYLAKGSAIGKYGQGLIVRRSDEELQSLEEYAKESYEDARRVKEERIAKRAARHLEKNNKDSGSDHLS